jgi:hypothetical protein
VVKIIRQGGVMPKISNENGGNRLGMFHVEH